MKNKHGCDCETTRALVSKDTMALVDAVKKHVPHKCPNFTEALHVVIIELTADANVYEKV